MLTEVDCLEPVAEMALKHVEELFRCEFDLAGNA